MLFRSPTFSSVGVGWISLADAFIGTATTSISNTSATVVDSWSATAFKSAKYIVQMRNGTDIEVLEVLVTVDGNNNVYLTEYADVQSIVLVSGNTYDVFFDASVNGFYQQSVLKYTTDVLPNIWKRVAWSNDTW